MPSIPPPATAPPPKSAAAAFVMTLVYPGVGHWYAGEKDRAVAFGGTTLVAVLLSLVHPAIALIATIAVLWSLLDVRHAVDRNKGR